MTQPPTSAVCHAHRGVPGDAARRRAEVTSRDGSPTAETPRTRTSTTADKRRNEFVPMMGTIWVQYGYMSRARVASVRMAPPRKGPRKDKKVRIPADLNQKLKDLAFLHETSEQTEISEAIAARVNGHDPETCPNAWCVARRSGRP